MSPTPLAGGRKGATSTKATESSVNQISELEQQQVVNVRKMAAAKKNTARGHHTKTVQMSR